MDFNLEKKNMQSYIPTLYTLTQRAGEALLAVYQTEDFGIENKADDSPVTRADKASNDIICAGLAALTPSYPIVSEENLEISYAERQHFEYYWCVDPLDGTKEFIKRNDDFVINIALIHRNKPVLGVVYVPVLNEFYWAIEGKGAFQTIDGIDIPLRADSFTMAQSGLSIAVSRSHFTQKIADYVANFQYPRLTARGSALKIMLIAKGNVHLYPCISKTMEWDTAAPQIILQEAGGQLLNHATNMPLIYNKENLGNPEFVAYGKRTDV
jgi:3'(2'), 5'-bisphosphate nucleotidase